MIAFRPPLTRGAVTPSGVAVAVVVAGSTVLLAGTFFPWLASGAEQRNLYSAAGVVQRIAGLGQPIGFVLDAVPLVGLFLVLCAAVWVWGHRGVAGVAVAVVTVLLGLVAGAAIGHQQAGSVRIVGLGPTITLTGAGITVAGLVLLLMLNRRAAAARRVARDHAASAHPVPPARSSRMELT